MRISDWSSDVCSSDLFAAAGVNLKSAIEPARPANIAASRGSAEAGVKVEILSKLKEIAGARALDAAERPMAGVITSDDAASIRARSEEHSGGNDCVRTCRFRGEPYP